MAEDGRPTPDPSGAQDWRDLASQASKEADPQKLTRLVQQLCDRLDHIEQQKKGLAQLAGWGRNASTSGQK
jgi:hypothetical protein